MNHRFKHYNEGIRRVGGVIQSGGDLIKLDYTNSMKNLLQKYGSFSVVGMYVGKSNLASHTKTFLRVITLGRLDTRDIFHANLYVILARGPIIQLDKNHVIEGKVISRLPGDARRVNTVPTIPFHQFLDNARKYQGDTNYFRYDPRHANCQKFDAAVIHGNHIHDPAALAFTQQDSNEALKSVPHHSESTMKGVTDTLAVAAHLLGHGIHKRPRLNDH